jgi:hypothetical protein
MLKARMLWAIGAGLAMAGSAGLLYFIAALSARFGLFSLPVPMPGLHVATAAGLLSAALACVGALVARRQAERIREDRRRAADRLRRVHLYREDARREPFLGEAHGESNPLAGRRAAR